MRASPLPTIVIAIVALAAGCSSRSRSEPDASTPLPDAFEPPTSHAPSTSLNAVTAAPDASSADAPSFPGSDGGAADAAAGAEPDARTDGCEQGMVRVEGEYCPVVIHKCLKHHKEYDSSKDDKNVSERCLRYKEPSRCFVNKRAHLSFCMDRYEYPNRVGEMPWVLTSWLQAKALCEKQGKRLCTEDEFNFACEGPEILPYAYGFVRDEAKCNIDRPYERPDLSKKMLTYEKCLLDERCLAELKRLDQRHAIGSRMTCVSWAGVVDINGNVNEWVERVGKKPPHRSGLKGGWWGPVRSRCRPTVDFHKEFDYGYEAGFRCCKDAAG
ncbi:MAG: SUMF1/EgtB/PvdO family nonheme iron enzyme [Deltaproteobacteria bacterium]|nr:SUMF1/EgtB/PvdO family nonheme iron enzyme [Deltaproteobacteria bacterium]